jgi:hypothetical protein
MLRHNLPLVVFISISVVVASLSGCGGLNDAPGSIAFSLSWEEQPEGVVYIWLRVEERHEGPETSGPTLASAGPAEYEENKSLSLTLDAVPNGKNRVVVVEVRKGASTELPVLFFGISEPFELGPGTHVKVEVPLKIQKPETQTSEAQIDLLFAGESLETVDSTAIIKATVQVRSVAAARIVMANDASFAANLTTVNLESSDGVNCRQVNDGEMPIDVCEIGPWDLTAGLPGNDDGQYTLYAKLVDKNGYESEVYKESVILDSTPPKVLVASISPEVINAGQSAVITATFHENLAAEGVGTELVAEPTPEGVLKVVGPTQIGSTTTYAWTASVVLDTTTEIAEFTFAVIATDAIANTSEAQSFDNLEGDALALRIDAVGPSLVDPEEIQFNEVLFGLPGEEDGLTESLTFNFAFREDSVRPMAVDENGLCVDGCPEVRLGGKKLGKVLRDEDQDDVDNGVVGFSYQYPVKQPDWGEIEQTLDVSIVWADLAGNQTLSTLEQTIRFDFIRPGATLCNLVPQQANANSVITYSITVSEPLDGSPVLVKEDGAKLWFAEEPTVVGNQTFVWGQAAVDITQDEVSLAADLLDLAGNASAAPVCPETVQIDSSYPQVTGLQVSTLPEVLDATGTKVLAAGLEDTVVVAFEVTENQGLEAGFPEVALSVAGVPVAMEQQLAGEDGETLQFEYSLALDEQQEALKEGLWPVVITLKDTAGNTTVKQGEPEDFVQLDFTAPVANCTVLGQGDGPFAIGETITLQVSPNEELASATQPVLTVSLNPSVEGDYFHFVEESNYWFNHVVMEGEGEREFSVEVALTDLVGNQTLEGANACVSGPLVGGVDGKSPQIVDSTLQVSTQPEVTNSAGGTVLAVGVEDSIHVTFTVDENKELASGFPQVALSVGGFLVPFEQVSLVEQGDLIEFEYQLTLGPEEALLDEGLWPVIVALQDTSGNASSLQAQPQDFVQLDFTPPIASCTVLGQDDLPFAIGETITLQISPNEELATDSLPALTIATDPPVEGEYFLSVDDSKYWYAHEVTNGEGESEFSVEVSLTDLVGNATPVDGNACQGGPLSGLVDGQIPVVVGVQLAVPAEGYEALERPLKAGIPVQATLQIENSALLPEVTIGSKPMTALSQEPDDLGEDLSQFVFERTLDGTEDEGPQLLSVAGTDSAGNGYNYLQDEAQLTFDYQAPLAYCFLFPTGAKGGDEINLTVSSSEPLQDNQPELVADLPFDLVPAEVDSTDFAFVHQVQEGDPDAPEWNYAVTVTDLAGNVNEEGTGCTGTGAIDSTVPTVIGGEEGIAVSRRSLKDQATLEISFTLAEGEVLIKNPAVKVGTSGLPLIQSDGSSYVYSHTAHKDGDSPDEEGTYALSITLMDKAGNVQIYTPGTVTFDFTPPSIEDTTIAFSPPAGCRLDAVTAMTHGSVLDLTIVVDDQLKEPPEVTVEGESLGTKSALSTDPEDPYRVVFHHQFDGGLEGALPVDTEETADVKVVLTDPAENVAEFTIGQVPIDTALPALPETETPGTIVYSRVPWGTASTSGKKAFTVRGLSGAVAPNCHVYAFDGIHVDESFLIGQTVADEDGAFGGTLGSGDEFNLTLADRERVYLLTIDTACNEADGNDVYDGVQGTVVREAELVITPGLRIPGDDISNPNVFQERIWFDNLKEQGDQTEPENAAILATGQGEGVTTEGGGTWQLWDYSDDQPEPRFPAGVAWDTRRQVMVVYGGSDGTKVFTDTWEWDGTSWSEIIPEDPESDGNPPALTGAAMAYDESRSRMVLFGGWHGGELKDKSDEVWEWDGKSWWLRIPLDPEEDGNPTARGLHSMVYSPLSSTIISYGGDHNYGGHMWEWDGTSWKGHDDAETPAGDAEAYGTYYHCMAYDPVRQKIVLFGGNDGHGGYYPDVWEYDGSQWTEVQPVDELGDGNPDHSDDFSMVYSSAHQRMVMWDGRKALMAAQNLVWTWDGQEWEVFQPEGHSFGPPALTNPSISYDPIRQAVVLFGGQLGVGWGDPLNTDLWLLPGDNQSWTLWQPQNPDHLPPGVTDHDIGYDPTRHATTISRGYGLTWSSGCYEFDGWQWSTPGCPGGSVTGYATTFDPDDGRLLTVGCNHHNNSELGAYTWDGEAYNFLTFTDPEGDGNPECRNTHGLAYDLVNHEAIVFGGSKNRIMFDDTWIYNGESWRLWEEVDPEGDGSPMLRYRHHMTWDYTTDTVMMFGGTWEQTDNAPGWGNPDVMQWQWTGVSWAAVEPTDPEDDGWPMVSKGIMTPNVTIVGIEELDRVLAVSPGVYNSDSGQTEEKIVWQWDGTSWRSLDNLADRFGDGGPPLRNGAGIVWETHHQRLLTYGGDLPVGDSSELWFWWPGTDVRPGHTFTVEAGGSGIGLKDVKSVQVSWKAGGSGTNENGFVDGVNLLVWRSNSWVLVDSTDAGADSPSLLNWSTEEQFDLVSMMMGHGRQLGFAVQPSGWNGVDYATIQSDSVEVTLSYSSGANCDCADYQSCNQYGECVHKCGDGWIDPGESCENDFECDGENMCWNCICQPEPAKCLSWEGTVTATPECEEEIDYLQPPVNSSWWMELCLKTIDYSDDMMYCFNEPPLYSGITRCLNDCCMTLTCE